MARIHADRHQALGLEQRQRRVHGLKRRPGPGGDGMLGPRQPAQVEHHRVHRLGHAFCHALMPLAKERRTVRKARVKQALAGPFHRLRLNVEGINVPVRPNALAQPKRVPPVAHRSVHGPRAGKERRLHQRGRPEPGRPEIL